MAESDKMLIAVEFDANGAIKQAEILDTKFDKLGNTLRKGKARTEGMTAAQEKLTNAQKKGTKSTTEQNVSSIAKLAALEATTSAINQGISARYKQIDADVAAGRISAEEGERKRKQVKELEKYTGAMEMVIAAERLRTVGVMIMTAATAKSTAATNANTTATNANTTALLKNPYVLMGLAIAALVLMLVRFWQQSGAVRRRLEDVGEVLDKITGKWNGLKDAVRAIIPDLATSEAVLGSANITGDTFR
tara:strand:- start:404 stop:1150 length:747 start_codon:yes stop_codon:yes gene_type:complete